MEILFQSLGHIPKSPYDEKSYEEGDKRYGYRTHDSRHRIESILERIGRDTTEISQIEEDRFKEEADDSRLHEEFSE